MNGLSRREMLAAGIAITAVPASAARPVAAPKPYGAVPSPRQLAWHKRLQYAFIHFSINSFTNREWGYGDESPALFNPTDFSADQIVAAAKAGGMRGIILTAKHHDGFCLWPTDTTDHCIRNSPYRQGKGDIVREFQQAARRAGLGFGLYLSPWDRNHADYGRPAYIDTFRQQITELCTRYGELFEFWFDGANGGDGWYGGAQEVRKIDAQSYYRWPEQIALVHKHQPMACTFEPLGADIRWIGNEDGVAGDPCWPTMNDAVPDRATGNAGVRGGKLWWPAETNTSIRPGWFYHADEDARVKGPDRLLRLFDESVARGTNMHLNLPPDRRGRIADHDAAVLKSFGDAQAATYATNLAEGARASADATRGAAFAAARVLDGNDQSYWCTPDAVTTPSLTLDLPAERRFDLVRLREYLPLGVRVTRFAVEAEVAGAWTHLATHECIGAQRIIRLAAPITARRVRLRILEAPACPAISEIALFLQVAPVAVAPPRATGPVPLPRTGWRIVAASAPGAEAMLNEDWTKRWTFPAPTPANPASVTIDLGRAQPVAGFSLTPSRTSRKNLTPPHGYRFETSVDGKAWERPEVGEFSNIAYALNSQTIVLPKVRQARYIRLRFDAPALPVEQVAIAGIEILTPQP